MVKTRKAKRSKEATKLEPGLAGVAGEFYVAAELSRRGYLATLTQRNTRGVDILASNVDASSSVTIQVKTNSGYQSHWILTKKSEDFHGPRLFYVLVNLGAQSGHPEFHVVPSRVVAKYISESHANWLKTPGKKGQAHKDNNMRKFDLGDSKYLGRWDLLGLD